MNAACEAHASAPRERPVGDAVAVVLVGRPNAGKSSLYNLLTGGDARVGNFPGITVDVLEARVEHCGRALRVIDLPGLYTLSSGVEGETDEAVARRFLDDLRREGTAAVLVQVMDSTCPALGLRLTRDLLAREAPLIVAATQRDVLDAQGRSLDLDALEAATGSRFFAVSAKDPSSRRVVLDAALEALDRGSAPSLPSFDPDALGRAALKDRADASDAALRARQRTERIDRWMLHPYLGPLLFVGLMAGLFSAVFLVADPASAAVDGMMHAVAGVVGPRLGAGMLRSFVIDGLLGGAGTVLVFLPQIVVLTVAMELLDASGYLARGVFLVDRFLRGAGLGGRAFVPLLTGHACAVPAIAATRIIRDPRERLTAMLVIPLMTCSARIPTYAVLLSAFFASKGASFRAVAFVALYVLGITSGLVASFLLRRTVTRGRALPLLLEMPGYHAPEARVVVRIGWRAALRFLKDVGTTILVASAVLWALLNVPMPAALDRAGDTSSMPASVARMHHSVGAGLGRALEPVTRVAGFDWRMNVGLMGSFGARELMVGTLGVIAGLEDVDDDGEALAVRLRELRKPDGSAAYSTATGLSLMVFFVIACQCMSTVAAIKRETRSWRWALFTLVWTYVLGFALAAATYQLSKLVTA